MGEIQNEYASKSARIIIVVLVPGRSQRTVRLMSSFISDRPCPHQWQSPSDPSSDVVRLALLLSH